MNTDFVTLHLLKPSTPGDRSLLTGEEISRAAKFRFPEDAARWISYHTSLRRILGLALGIAPRLVPIRTAESGKPMLAEPFEEFHFSLSHVDDLALIAISKGSPVGIDVEPKKRAIELLGCESSFCHPDELKALPASANARSELLLELWTMKEAVLKAVGTGFLTPPETVKMLAVNPTGFQAIDDGTNEELKRQFIQPLSHPELDGYQVALSSRLRMWKLVPSGESTNFGGSARINPSDG